MMVSEKFEACPDCSEAGIGWSYDAQYCSACGYNALRPSVSAPDTYVMSRDEWLEVNRVLSGAALSLSMQGSKETKEKRKVRLQAVRYAQTIMSEVYQRALAKARGDSQ